jgi:hypothetical protein
MTVQTSAYGPRLTLLVRRYSARILTTRWTSIARGEANHNVLARLKAYTDHSPSTAVPMFDSQIPHPVRPTCHSGRPCLTTCQLLRLPVLFSRFPTSSLDPPPSFRQSHWH